MSYPPAMLPIKLKTYESTEHEKALLLAPGNRRSLFEIDATYSCPCVAKSISSRSIARTKQMGQNKKICELERSAAATSRAINGTFVQLPDLIASLFYVAGKVFLVIQRLDMLS